jgi:hypothetical protein
MLLLPVRPLAQSHFPVAVAAYVLGIALAGAVTAGGVYRLASALLDDPAARAPANPPGSVPAHRVADRAPLSRIPSMPNEPNQTLVRESAMLPLQDRWGGVPRFGTSSRGPSSPYPRRSFFGRLFDRDDDDDDRLQRGGTYRTVCVRLCDGYYFPISFAVTADRLQRDAKVCESRCGAQGRLFVHHNPGGSAEDMVDLAGRPYQQLPSAFLYRTQYVPSCQCQAHPWEAASLDRHRVYALAAAVRNGSKDAAKELQALQAKVRQTARTAPAQAAAAASESGPPKLAQNPPKGAPDEQELMRLGTDQAPKLKPSPPEQPRGNLDWRRRAFEPNN